MRKRLLRPLAAAAMRSGLWMRQPLDVSASGCVGLWTQAIETLAAIEATARSRIGAVTRCESTW